MPDKRNAFWPDASDIKTASPIVLTIASIALTVITLTAIFAPTCS